jgi:hypothetical protein
LEFEISTEKLKRYKSPGIDWIPAELIQGGGDTLRSESHKILISIWYKEELPLWWKESISVIYKKGDKTGCSNYGVTSLFTNYIQNLIQYSCQILTTYVEKIIGIINVDLDIINQLLIGYSAFARH